VLAAFLGNLALAVLKGVAAAITGSSAMVAETFRGPVIEPTRAGERPPFGAAA